MTESPPIRRAFSAEVVAALRGTGPARWAATLLVLTTVGLVGGRRLSQGVLVGTSAFDVTVLVLREALPVVVMAVAGVRYAQRRQVGVDRALYLGGLGPATRLVVVAADALVVLVGAWVGPVMAIWLGAGGLDHQPARDLATLLVGTALCTVVVAALSALAARLASSTSMFLGVALAAPLVGSLLYWAGSIYPVLDLAAQLWPWQAASTFLAAGTPGRWLVGAVVSAVTVGTALALLARDPQQPRRAPDCGERPRAHRTAAAARTRVAGAVAATALVWGLAVPATLSRFVPWYLRPQWLGDESRHESSQDVATAWLRAVQVGDEATADRLGVAPSAQVAGPLASWLRTQNPATATMDRTYDGDPGVVSFDDDRNDGKGAGTTVFVCLTRSTSGWRVRAVRSQDDCARVGP